MKKKQEKKQYTTPAMEVVAYEHAINLLVESQTSEMPQTMGVTWDDDE